ncbi:Tetratricopeptide repeat protein [compost metagenome]
MLRAHHLLLSLSVSICLLLCSLNGLAQQDSFSTLFNEGVKLYQTKDFIKAAETFTKALELDPHNATALTNLALVQYQLNNKGLAIALFRHALEINPELPTARAGLKFALSQLEIKEVPHRIENYENLRTSLLQPVPVIAYQVLTALLLVSAGWILISYWGRRKRAIAEEKAFPSFPYIGALLALGFLVSLTLLSLKIYDQSIPRGTIITEKVSLQAAPGEDQVSVLDLYTGFEVVVHQSSGDWIQVTYPGSLTGWMKKSDLYLTSGK